MLANSSSSTVRIEPTDIKYYSQDDNSIQMGVSRAEHFFYTRLIQVIIDSLKPNICLFHIRWYFADLIAFQQLGITVGVGSRSFTFS